MSPSTGHMDRLTAVDASFLTNETAESHMHIGAVLVFEGPPPAYEEFCHHVGSRLPLVPRYRQKLATPPLEAGRPLWVDDAHFNLAFHMHHTALPEPGGRDELRDLADRIFSQPLDRTKPLWELWLVQGLEGNRFAILTKSHHAMIDGISGVDIGTVLFDITRDAKQPDVDESWTPHPEPSSFDLFRRGIGALASAPIQFGERILRAASNPEATLQRVSSAVEGVAEVGRAFADPAPSTPLNVRIGPHRRIAWVQADLADMKRIKDGLGGTVNDVVLTVVAGALRRWLDSRDFPTGDLELRAMVPVSIRAEDERGNLGNRLAAMRGPLPVYEDDPVERLAIVREAMEGLKESKQALGAEVISRLNDFAPPTLLAQAARLTFSTRLFNLLVTNVPGPQMPLFVLGRELEVVVPVPFLARNQALAVAIISYNGKVNFGLLGDYDAMPDIDVISRGLRESLRELLDAAGG